jgi:hypothetical protein
VTLKCESIKAHQHPWSNTFASKDEGKSDFKV